MNKRPDMPLVSIAVPIFNEEKYIQETLESIICQDYPNIEIFISDNCSTDKTPLICKDFVQKDSRITYHRHSKNIGAGDNHTYTMRKLHGKYLMFAAGHDKWSRNLVSECVAMLEKHKNATLAFGTPTWIGEDGRLCEKFTGWYDSRGLNPVARFNLVFWGGMNPILGVLRRNEFPDLKNYNFTGADLVVLSSLALKGEFIHATKASFQRRQNRPVERYKEKLQRYKSKDMQVARNMFLKLFPLAKLPVELIKTVILAPIGVLDKISILVLLLPSMPTRYFLGRKDHNK